MKSQLLESMSFNLYVKPDICTYVDQLLFSLGEIDYPELTLVLIYTKYLAELHQNNHWQSKGDSYYGDHLLFQRLYEAVNGEIDVVAEKAIGIGSNDNVNFVLISNNVNKLIVENNPMPSIPRSDDLVRQSLEAEMNYIKVLSLMADSMTAKGTYTKGVDNMIAGIIDIHEGHVYLLKQRCN